MSVTSGPSILTNSLVVAVDSLDNSKSWKGKPAVNILSVSGLNAAAEQSGTTYPFVNTNITAYVLSNWSTSNNKLSISFEGKRDYAGGGTGGGGDGYPVMYIYFSDWSWSAAISISTYDWSYTKQENIVIPDPTGKSVFVSVYHMNAGNPGKSYSRNHQVEFNTFATPFVSGTRSTEQSIIDMSSNSTLSATELTYNSDNTVSFDGVNDRITVSNFPNKPASSITCTAWIYPTRAVSVGTVRGAAVSASSSLYLGIFDSADGGATHSLHWAVQTSSGRPTSASGQIPRNEWSYIVGTYDGTTSRAYVNGVEVWSSALTGTINDGTYYIGAYGGSPADGTHNFAGKISNAQIYNRALSAAEIKNNYNALKTRFGL